MKPEDAKRLADTEVMLSGRTRYVGQEERTDEFLYRLVKDLEAEVERLTKERDDARRNVDFLKLEIQTVSELPYSESSEDLARAHVKRWFAPIGSRDHYTQEEEDRDTGAVARMLDAVKSEERARFRAVLEELLMSVAEIQEAGENAVSAQFGCDEMERLSHEARAIIDRELARGEGE
jgi:hypothetical protein